MKQVKILFFIIGLSVSSLSFGLGEEGGAYKVIKLENKTTSPETPMPLDKGLTRVIGAWITPSHPAERDRRSSIRWAVEDQLARSLFRRRSRLELINPSGTEKHFFRYAPEVVPTVGQVKGFIRQKYDQKSYCRFFTHGYEEEFKVHNRTFTEEGIKNGATVYYVMMNSADVLYKIYGLADEDSKLRKFSSLDTLRRTEISKWPGVIINNEGLISLDLSSRELTGVLPAELEQLLNLENLDLSDNQITGFIPTELGALRNLRNLCLSFNSLKGVIPSVLGELVNLESLDFHGNYLTGAIPTELGRLMRLKENTLSSNQLTGSIPSELGCLVDLKHLDLSHNDLGGPIPSELGNLGNLEHLDFSNNYLTGAIPIELERIWFIPFVCFDDNRLTTPNSL